jgi:uncharacterized membrane protein
MAGIYFLTALICGAFLFAVIGVIVLLGKTRRYEEGLEQNSRRIGELEGRIGLLEGAALTAAVPYPDLFPEEGNLIGGAEGRAEQPPEEAPEQAEAERASAMPEGGGSGGDILSGSGPEARDGEGSALPHPPGAPGNSLAAFVHGGNLWAAGGISLLIAAFAMLITYLARHGFFTVEMGIASAALSGLFMLVLGWRFRRRRPVYFLLLQGGGIGILYLSVFAAHKLTPYFPPIPSLVLMSLLIPPALLLAFFQNSQPMAFFSFLGGFAAPLLFALNKGGHVSFFAYYLVLDLGVLAAGFRRSWKGPKLLAFCCTFAAALYWVTLDYEPRFFWSAEPFFVAFILLFTVLGLWDGRGKGRKTDTGAVLILGTPFIAALLQWKIFSFIEHGYAIISLVFSALYLLAVLFLRKKRGMETVAEGYLGLSVLLANLAIPLELAPWVSGAVWAAEGVLVFLFGLRRKNRRIAAAALVLHAAAAIAFAAGDTPLSPSPGLFRSPDFTGSLIIACSALAILLLKNKQSRRDGNGGKPGLTFFPAFDLVLGCWAFIWWFAGWFIELDRLGLSSGYAFFILSSLSALGASWGGWYFRCPALYTGAIPAPAFALIRFLGMLLSRTGYYLTSHPTWIFTYNFFEGPWLWAWFIFFAVEILILVFFRRGLDTRLQGARIFTVVLAAAGVLSATGRAYTKLLGLSESWTCLAGVFPGIGALISLSLGRRFFPNLGGIHRKLLFLILPGFFAAVLGLWFLVTLFLSGDPAPLPFYIPILNPLDILEGFCIAAILFFLLSARSGEGRRRDLRLPVITGDIMVFLWINVIIGRSVHFYGQVPLFRLFGSGTFHLCVFAFWGLYGIFHIVLGHRRSQRPLWIAGAALTLADIVKLLIFDLAGTGAVPRISSFFIAGLILLFIGWIAPLPPAILPEKKEP